MSEDLLTRTEPTERTALTVDEIRESVVPTAHPLQQLAAVAGRGGEQQGHGRGDRREQGGGVCPPAEQGASHPGDGRMFDSRGRHP